MHLQELSASRKLNSFVPPCFGIFTTWPGTGEWFQQAALHLLQKRSEDNLSGAGLQVFSGSETCSVQNSQGLASGLQKTGMELTIQSSWKIRRV
jgi:hypothetical protein